MMVRLLPYVSQPIERKEPKKYCFGTINTSSWYKNSPRKSWLKWSGCYWKPIRKNSLHAKKHLDADINATIAVIDSVKFVEEYFWDHHHFTLIVQTILGPSLGTLYGSSKEFTKFTCNVFWIGFSIWII